MERMKAWAQEAMIQALLQGNGQLKQGRKEQLREEIRKMNVEKGWRRVLNAVCREEQRHARQLLRIQNETAKGETQLTNKLAKQQARTTERVIRAEQKADDALSAS